MFRVCPRYISVLQKQRGVHLEFTATVELFFPVHVLFEGELN